MVQQLSTVQLRQLTSSQAAAFGIISSQNTQFQPPPPQQEQQQQQLTNATNINTNSTENVVPPAANSTAEVQQNQTDTSPDDPEMEMFKRDLAAGESEVVSTFVAEAMEAQLGKRDADPQDLRKKRKLKLRRGSFQ